MIRIRPTTQNVEVLEKLAGVKQGTAAELTQLFVDHDFDIENFQLFEIVSGKPDNPYHVIMFLTNSRSTVGAGLIKRLLR
jgi:hypothetical protein